MLNKAIISLFPLLTAALAPNQFGLVGPQNAMLFLNGFHFISGHSDHYLQANHHCVIMSTSFIQCALYAPGSNPARLAGIEYIITGVEFAKLPMEERKLWHSHQYEVSSGFLVEPGMPGNVDNEVMKILVDSYGKTFHTWRWDQKDSALPLGIPEFVNGYTGGGQLPQSFVDARDAYWGINTSSIQTSRKAIDVPPVQNGADAWKEGLILTLEMKETKGNVNFTSVAEKHVQHAIVPKAEKRET
jgi:hypothetical protein